MDKIVKMDECCRVCLSATPTSPEAPHPATLPDRDHPQSSQHRIVEFDAFQNKLFQEIILNNIFDEISFDGLYKSPASLLNEYFDAQIMKDDEFPQFICDSCLDKLKNVHSLKSTLENSRLILAQYAQDFSSSNIENDKDILDDSFGTVECIAETAPAERSDEDEDRPLSKVKKNKKYKTLHKKKWIREILKRRRLREPEPSSSSERLFCLMCDAKFADGSKLHAHCLRKHRVTDKVGRKCDYCDDKFEDFRSLLIHRKRHSTPFLCEHCWTGYFTGEELEYHFTNCKKLNGKNEPKENCDSREMDDDRSICQCHICGKAYSTSYIHCHMLIHGESKYRCEECGKSFKQPRSLQSHIQFIHKKEKNLKCSMCDAAFVTSGARSTHIRQIHEKEKKFGCDVCDKRFFGSYNLKKHMLTHTDVRIFTCNYCEKTYQSQSSLTMHLKSHCVEDNNVRYTLM